MFPDYVQLLKQGIWAVDETARTTFITKRMAEMLGYTAEEMIGQPFHKFVDEREKEFAEATLAVLEKDRNAREEIDLQFTRKDGPKISRTVSLAPFFSDSGKFTGALAIVTGIPGAGLERGPEQDRGGLPDHHRDTAERRRDLRYTRHDPDGKPADRKIPGFSRGKRTGREEYIQFYFPE